MKVIDLDRTRYNGEKMPRMQFFLRKTQNSSSRFLKLLYKMLFVIYRNKNCCEIVDTTVIGEGLYIGHPFGIIINKNAVIGCNVNIHKGVTIGQENRGKRQGCPVIGNDVWIGINSTIVGKIAIGNDVLIAPNSFVNFDVPDHSIVIGNPAKIIRRQWATEGYINNRIDINEL